MLIVKMKKIIKLVLALIIACLVIFAITFLIDCTNARNGRKPICSKLVNVLDDGGTEEYIGFGYKIIGFNSITGGAKAKLFNSEIELVKEQENYVIDEKENEDYQNVEQSNDVIENEVNNEVDNESDSTIEMNIEEHEDTIEPEYIEPEINNSGEEQVIDEIIHPYFNASVIGVNGSSVIVKPWNNEEILNSADLISFSIQNIILEQELVNNANIRITYTGEILETYPAQIIALEIDFIE